jgi:O-antigen/teichoic acid export membrane protein
MVNDRLLRHIDFRQLVSLTKWSDLLKDSFYSNSVYLTLSRATAAAAGLLFWIIAAKFYSQGDVGIATTLISTSTLVAFIAMLGMGQSMIHYHSIYDRSKILGTSLRITSYCSVLIAGAFLLVASLWAPDLAMTASFIVFFVLLSLATTIVTTTGFAFTAERNAKYTFVQQFILGSRVLFLIPLIVLGALGIMVSMALASVLVVAYSAVVLYKQGLRVPRIDWSYFRESVWFSAGNYVSSLLQGLPALAMPIIVYGRVGASDTAVYFMAASIATIAAVVPTACSDSLFVEVSHGAPFGRNAMKAIKTSLIILVPVSIGIYIFGSWLLGFFGSGYASSGTEVLRLLSFSVFFFTFLVVIMTWARVRKRMRALVLMTATYSVMTISLSYLFIGHYGINGIGYAFIISYAVSAVAGMLMVSYPAVGIIPGENGHP